MDGTIALFLIQDGVINGAVYALVGMALVLVFAVSRVILVPQGEFVAFAGLTLAALEAGRIPSTPWLLLALGVLAAISDVIRARFRLQLRRLVRIALLDLVMPLALVALTKLVAPMRLGQTVDILLTLALIVPMGPMIYRVAFEPLAQASVLVLLIASFGVHLSLMGLGLGFFGPEGVGTPPLAPGSFDVGALVVTGQSIVVLATTVALVILFAWLSERTLFGKALRACSSNRLGARLVGIPTAIAGRAVFAIAALLGAVAGVLVSPIVTIYYDSGFLLGLKAFVAAILGGLLSYPLTVAAAILVGLFESFSSFFASAYKDALVFTLIIPVLVWRSLRSATPESGRE